MQIAQQTHGTSRGDNKRLAEDSAPAPVLSGARLFGADFEAKAQ